MCKNICGMSNTVPCMLPFTVLCMCSVVCTQCTTAHLVSFGYICVCDDVIMLYVLVHECMVYSYLYIRVLDLIVTVVWKMTMQ